jgi:MoxR-like ATPase
MTNVESIEDVEQRIESARRTYAELKAEMAQAIVGHEALIEHVFIALVCSGHCLLEGVPGLGKTLIVRSLGEILGLTFSRIQFTPDLMPADITGTNLLADDASGRKIFAFQSGPVFANIVLADEINRATPKTQSALLEAMQESSVTVGGKAHRLETPFMVLATQNPLEMEGTYPLPEAQVDRFFFKLIPLYPNREELSRIADLTTAAEPHGLKKVLDGAAILEIRRWVREVPIAEMVKDYAVRLILATQAARETGGDGLDTARSRTSRASSAGGKESGGEGIELVRRFVLYGSSPRGLQTLILAAKARALLAGRPNVSFDDIRSMIMPGLRHRLILKLEADAEGISSEQVLAEVVRQVPEVP